jgi:DNA invertase Pin-like site-specific DNA recombinase
MSKPLRCAIYTRVSSDQRLEQDFNSLDAQREAAEAYIKSQAHEGWRLRRDRYDDGGFSGGSMERPALCRLLADIREGRIDVVVVYKVDRLTRSLADFAKLVELFDRQKVSFVSVTQSFNTTSSMGRLTLNVLLSFAQFEREVTGERIRDKIAASKRKGLWMGGVVPMGYRVENRKLIVDEEEAASVRKIFERYLALRSIPKLQAELRREGLRTRERVLATGRTVGNVHLTNGPLAYMLRNRMYLGEINHKSESFPADHAAIVGNDLFDAVQSVLSENLNRRDLRKGRSEALLLGLLFDDRGNRMSPSHAVKKGVRYRYYVSSPVAQGRKEDAGSVYRVSANGIQQAVREALRARVNISGEARASSDRKRKASELSDEESLRRVRRIELRADRILITTLADGAGGQYGKEEQHEDPDLDPPVCATFEVGWRAPSSHPTRHIFLPVNTSATKAKIKPLRNEERLKLLRAIITARTLRDSVLPLPEDSIDAIASRHGKTERWARKHLTLAFLDPKLVEAAVDGVLPRGYGLSRFFDLPADWNEQWRVLGLRNPRSDDLAGPPREH